MQLVNPGTLPTYAAVRVVSGSIRRLWFEATGEPEAREFCASVNAGYEGPADRPENNEPLPNSYPEDVARRLLGGISRSSLYRMVIRGDVDREPGTRRLLITRTSIERRRRTT